MKFSILIAHFNNGEYFKACYESIINQTYTNWEAIILDDASQPEEIELVKKTIGTDKRFSFYKNDKNEGVGFTKKSWPGIIFFQGCNIQTFGCQHGPSQKSPGHRNDNTQVNNHGGFWAKHNGHNSPHGGGG